VRREMKGLIAYSFALTEHEPNRCNRRLAEAVRRIVKEEDGEVVVVAQWEITRALRPDEYALSVELPADGSYLGSEEVTEAAARLFREKGIKEVIPVAQPFLQLSKCKKLIKAAGFRVVKRDVGKIGFEPGSLQWWTRSKAALFVYALMQIPKVFIHPKIKKSRRTRA
jgi:hypothetical protein